MSKDSLKTKRGLVLLFFIVTQLYAFCSQTEVSELCAAYKALQESNSLQEQKRFFEAFPKTWNEFIDIYGFTQKSLYEVSHEHINAFGNLDMIDDSIYIDRLILLSLGAVLDADAPSYLQSVIRNKMFQSDEIMEKFLYFIAKLKKGHQMQFWQFFWSSIIYDAELADKYILLLRHLGTTEKEVVSITYHYFNGEITYPFGSPYNYPF